MAAQDGLTFEGTFNNGLTGLYKDNTTNDISEADLRALPTAIRESYLNRIDDAYTGIFPQFTTATSTTAYTGTANPAITAYATGQKFQIKAHATSTGDATLALNGLAAKKWFKSPTAQATIGDLVINQVYIVVYDATLDSANGGFLLVGSSSNYDEEFNRTFSETLVFDKKEIYLSSFTMTDDINFTVGSGGLVNKSSRIRAIITFDGVHAVNFGESFEFLYGITNGQVLEAGTYELYFLYTNGSVSVDLPGVSSQSSSIVQLQSPGSFAAVPGTDPETEIDLSWTDVSNESSYEIQYSTTGGSGPWIALTNPVADATSYTHTGLTAGTTYHYRIRAVGDGVFFASSAYVVTATTTESSGDVTAPGFTFLPASGNTVWPVNKVITITADEPIRNTDGSELTDANISSRIILKETNSGGTNIAFTATIDVTKTIVTITPTTQYGENQLVYVAINNVEDVNGNEVTVAVSSTFTTTEHTFFNGTSNRLQFGDILDSLFTANDTNFWIELTVNNVLLSGTRQLVSKWDTVGNQRSFQFYIQGSNVLFGWAGNGAGTINRFVQWAGALSAGEHILVLKYDGSIDTNDGLDRVTLLVDGGTAGSKTLVLTSGTLPSIFNSDAELAVGAYVNNAGDSVGSVFFTEEAKDFIIRSTAGSVVVVNVANLKLGTDSSGNAHNGTWV